MRYLSLVEILELHERIISITGGVRGIRDLGALESAVSQPHLTFEQTDLYPDAVTKATALCFSLVMNYPFVDGNKRVAHAAMEVFWVLNGLEIKAPLDNQERLMLDLAAGKLTRQDLTSWLKKHVTPA
jgi:death-on-curing protein